MRIKETIFILALSPAQETVLNELGDKCYEQMSNFEYYTDSGVCIKFEVPTGKVEL